MCHKFQNLFGLNGHNVFCTKHSQREVEAAIVDSVLAEDLAMLLKSAKESMFKQVFCAFSLCVLKWNKTEQKTTFNGMD